eukprot:5365820-Pyramimonas_sp.AAC.1
MGTPVTSSSVVIFTAGPARSTAFPSAGKTLTPSSPNAAKPYAVFCPYFFAVIARYFDRTCIVFALFSAVLADVESVFVVLPVPKFY